MTTPLTNLTDSHILAYIPLRTIAMYGGGTRSVGLRWANQTGGSYSVYGSTVSGADGVYAGCCEFGEMKWSLGDPDQAEIVYPSVTLTLQRDRRDGQGGISDSDVTTLHDYNALKGYSVYLYRVSLADPNPSLTNQFFVGRVGRGDVEIDRETVTIKLSDRMRSDDKKLTNVILKTADYGYLATEWEGKELPALFGRWDYNSQQYWIEAPVVMRDNDDGDLRCRLALSGQWGLQSCGAQARWYASGGGFKGGVEHPFTISEDVGNGGLFTVLATNVDAWSYYLQTAQVIADYTDIKENEWQYVRWQDGDKIMVASPLGYMGIKHDDAVPALLTHPVDIIYSLLRDSEIGLGVAAADVDTDSFELIRDVILSGESLAVAAWVDGAKTTQDCIGELCREMNFKLSVVNGKYTLLWLGWQMLPATVADVTISGNSVMTWRESFDPRRVGFFALKIMWRKKPGDKTTQEYTSGNPDTAGDAETYTLDSEWIYRPGTLYNVAEALIYNRSGQPRIISATFDFNAETVSIGQLLRIRDHEDLEGVYQITELSVNLESHQPAMELTQINKPARVAIYADEIGEPVPEEYGGGTVPANWAAADVEQRRYLAYWADGTSNENPDGSEAKVYGE